MPSAPEGSGLDRVDIAAEHTIIDVPDRAIETVPDDDQFDFLGPGGTEICDGLDNNCNGMIDEGVGRVFYEDADRDGFGSGAPGARVIRACRPPPGYADNSLDCDDTQQLRNPRGTEVCDNVQTAVDSKHKLLVANDVPNDTGDRAWLSPMARQAKEVLGSPFDAVAAVGYSHGEEVKTCLEAGITPYVPRPITSANQKLGLFSKDDCTYDGATDTYQCPAGKQLTFRFATVEQGRHLRYDATAACRACPLKPQGTRNKGGRRLTRWVDEHLLEELEPRVRSRPEVMKQRKQLAELRRDNRELRRANEILKSAAAFFARELDPRPPR